MKAAYAVKELCRIYIGEGKVKYDYRPEWLLNPKTGRKIKVLVFIPHLKIGIDFLDLADTIDERVEINKTKLSLFKENGYELIQIKNVENLKDFVWKTLIPHSKLKWMPKVIKGLICCAKQDHNHYRSTDKYQKLKQTIEKKNRINAATKIQNEEKEANMRRMILQQKMDCA